MEDRQQLTDIFLAAYKKSLKKDCRFFYDDLSEYGNPKAKNIFYFIPGINGVPGQIKFALPGLLRSYGSDIYIKACYLKEYGAGKFIWEKYTKENADKKKELIISDLKRLTNCNQEVKVCISSSGFYDFVHAYSDLDHEVKEKLIIVWMAIAPDKFTESSWQKFFFRLNGFKNEGQKWFAVPNNNYLKIFNPETTLYHTWKFGWKKKFDKREVEVRFPFCGLYWCYVSTDCFNDYLSYCLRNFSSKIEIPACILAALNDGYWQNKGGADIEKMVDKYFVTRKIIFKNASHLWVLTPDNVEELFSLVKGLKA